ncbi:MAG: LPS assembly lipoprotein LptE [Dysgonamonadaceae bacterium]|nr:LPS assembly lipoprotein LptE [Dysgonamonadaceae bacterium]
MIIRIFIIVLGLVIVFFILSSCSFSYKFEGGSINYNLVKTINIQEFPNRAPLVNPSLAQIFDQKLRDRYISQTRLTPVNNNADIEITGEITGYDIQGLAVKEDAYASQTRLTVTIHLQYVNNKEEGGQEISQNFSAFREYSSERMLDEVQDQLCREICDDLVDMIYNATVANW